MSEAELAENKRNAVMNVWAFERAERHAEMLKQAAFAAAAAELKANPGDFDTHNLATHAAEVAYLEQVLAACAQFGIRDAGWRTALATLPRPVSAQQWAEGKGKW
jgi:hypothetical protein